MEATLFMFQVVLIASVVPYCMEGRMWCLCQELYIADHASCYEHYCASRATLYEILYVVVTPVKLPCCLNLQIGIFRHLLGHLPPIMCSIT